MATPIHPVPAAVGWLVRVLADVPDGDDWLTVAERDLLACLRAPSRRRDFRLGRLSAKHAVAAWLGARPASSPIEILTAPSGAPDAHVGGLAVPPALSLSHRDGRACCAVAAPGTALGCDLERLAARPEPLAACFTERERQLVTAAPRAEHARLATLVWSAKESAAKACGQGRWTPAAFVVARIGPLRRSGWGPLAVRVEDPAGASVPVLRGWWRVAPPMLLTVLADPPTPPPRALRAAKRADAEAR
jgi:4'-phosphopantetheinyl transferase EntD